MDVNALDRRPDSSTYVSSLTAATIPPPAASSSSSPGARKSMNSAEQERDRQAEEFKQSVTIIFWYKGKTEPIRLQQMIPSFPYFQLSRLSGLITDLGLTSSSYLDTYNPLSQQWEQHTISSVRYVESQQRLLYRIRKSLFEGLSEDDCVGLREEVHLQQTGGNPAAFAHHVKPHPASPQQTLVDRMAASPNLKRYASDTLESAHPNKIHVPNHYYGMESAADKAPQVPAPAPPAVSLPTPPSTAQALPTASSQDDLAYSYTSMQQTQQQQSQQQQQASPQQQHQQIQQQQAQSQAQQQQQQQQQNYYASPAATPGTQGIPSPYTSTSTTDKSDAPLSTSSLTVHYPPHPPLKRWPNDYTVAELTMGFTAMDQLIAQSPAGDNMTQRVAFERIFGLRYVKSTVCRHRAIWKKADRALRVQFESLGGDQRACWGEFVRRVEGRPAGKAGGGGGGVGVPGGVSGAGSVQTGVGVGKQQSQQQQQVQQQQQQHVGGAPPLTMDFHYQPAGGGPQGVVEDASGQGQHPGEGVPVMDSLQIAGAGQGGRGFRYEHGERH